jgi:hypothetical protein
MAAETPGNALRGLGMTAASLGAVMLPGSVGRVDDAVARADEVLALLRAGRASEVTDEMLAAADPRHLYDNYDLPMDEASRIARRDEGWRSNLPLYHGTDRDFQAFDLNRGGDATRNPAAAKAVWTAPRADVAAEFPPADVRAETGHQLLPLLHRASRPASAVLHEGATNYEVAGALDDAFSDGFDAVMFRNYQGILPENVENASVLAVRRPQQLRSAFARFDPRLSHLRNLSAALAAGYGVNALADYGQPQEPGL